MSQRLQQKVSASDILSSAIRSVADDTELRLATSRDFWKLVIAKAQWKILNVARQYNAGKRSIDSEIQMPGELADHRGSETAQQIVALLDNLSENRRAVALLLMQGIEVEEIARKLNRTARTVYRLSNDVEKYLRAATTN